MARISGLTNISSTNQTVNDDLAVTDSLTVGGATILNGTIALGDAITDTVGFYGTTKVAQRAGAAQAAVTTTVGSAVAGTSATAVTPYGYAQAQADAIVTNINTLRTDVLALATLSNELRAAQVALGTIKGAA